MLISAVNNNYKIIITNKLVFCYKDIVYSSFFLSIICFCFYLMNAWLRDWIDAYSVCYYLSRSTNNMTNNNSNNNEIWLCKWISKSLIDNMKMKSNQCLEQKGNEMNGSNDNKMWINGDMSFVSNHWNANSKQYPISNNTIFVYN